MVAPIAASTVAVMAPLSALQIGFLAGAARHDRRTGPLPRPAPVAVCAVR